MRTIERKVDAPSAVVWDLWTTAEGIERWWAPDGFSTDVRKLDLRVGGELVHAMTAVDPAQVEFLESHGLPLTTAATKTFTEIDPPTRLGRRRLSLRAG